MIQKPIILMDSNSIEIESSNNPIKKLALSDSAQSEDPSFQQVVPPANSNGFSNRITLCQVLPLILKLAMHAQMIMTIVIMHSYAQIIGISIVYSIISVIVMLLWYLSTKIDPTDPTQILHRQSVAARQILPSYYFKYFCHTCQTCVSKDSFHCKRCNRCVDAFDHHCKWLNNCIGARNYIQFFCLIISLEILIVIHLAVNIHSVIEGFKIQANWCNWVQITSIVLNLPLFIANSVLVSMHLYLVFRKKTTLDLIMERRKIGKVYPMKESSKEDKHQQNHQQQAQKSVNVLINAPKQSIASKIENKKTNTQKIEFRKVYSLKAKSRSFAIRHNHIQNK